VLLRRLHAAVREVGDTSTRERPTRPGPRYSQPDMHARHLVVTVGLALVSAACLGGTASPQTTSGFPRAARLIPLASCPVTRPNHVVPNHTPAFTAESLSLRNRWLGTILWPKGVLKVGRLPDGGSYASVRSDGWIYAKQGWWRSAHGQLRVVGQRLDRAAPKLRADVPSGYGIFGFEPVALLFPSMGCWKVTGTIGDKRLVYVVRLARA
jgi:hypothetical protein